MSNYPPGMPGPEPKMIRFSCPHCEEEWVQEGYNELGSVNTVTEPICPNACGVDPVNIPND